MKLPHSSKWIRHESQCEVLKHVRDKLKQTVWLMWCESKESWSLNHVTSMCAKFSMCRNELLLLFIFYCSVTFQCLLVSVLVLVFIIFIKFYNIVSICLVQKSDYRQHIGISTRWQPLQSEFAPNWPQLKLRTFLVCFIPVIYIFIKFNE